MVRLRDIMSTKLVTLVPELTLREAIELLTTEHVSGAPVVAGGVVAGVISTTDLLEFTVSGTDRSGERFDATEWDPSLLIDHSPKDESESASSFLDEIPTARDDDVADPQGGMGLEFLDEHAVAEAMSRRVLSLPPETSVSRGAQFMRDAGIHRVLIMEGEVLVGIVTTSDITRAVADAGTSLRALPFRLVRAMESMST